MNILKEDLNVFEDNEVYYLKNPSGNILQVTKEIAMNRFGFIWEPKEKQWAKVLPADEGFELVEKEDWQESENERLRGEGKPVATAPEPKAKEEPAPLEPEPEPEPELPPEDNKQEGGK